MCWIFNLEKSGRLTMARASRFKKQRASGAKRLQVAAGEYTPLRNMRNAAFLARIREGSQPTDL